jgi:hypothetical protein
MVDEGPRVLPASAYYGDIAAATSERASTAEIWQQLRTAAAARGAVLPPDMFEAVNQFRSIAAGLRNSSEVLARARDEDTIVNTMVGRQMYARDPDAMAIAPRFHVRYEMTATAHGETLTNTYTLDYTGGLPATVGDLRDDVKTLGRDLAEQYGSAFVSLGNIEIGAY